MAGVPAGIIFYREFSHWVMAPKIRTKPNRTEPDRGGWLRVTEVGRPEMNIVKSIVQRFPVRPLHHYSWG